MSDEPATKDFVDRTIKAERVLTDEKFEARDRAVELQLSRTHYLVTTIIAVVALLVALLALWLKR